MRVRTLLVWIAVGLIGLALAAGVTYAATQLSSQRIGLSAEPPSAGEELAPRVTHPQGSHTTTAPSQPTSTSTTTPGGDDQGGDTHDRDEERGEGVTRHSDWDD
jgi:hypothetical protein